VSRSTRTGEPPVWACFVATKDIITDYDLPAEMTATGEIVNGRPHVHAVTAIEGDRAISGHLPKGPHRHRGWKSTVQVLLPVPAPVTCQERPMDEIRVAIW
jgi:hypothetical protein